jgi:hypothetical protein
VGIGIGCRGGPVSLLGPLGRADSGTADPQIAQTLQTIRRSVPGVPQVFGVFSRQERQRTDEERS